MRHAPRGNAPSDRLLIKPNEAADLLAISPRKLWELKRNSEIPFVPIGKSVRYSTDALKKWIDEQSKGGDA